MQFEVFHATRILSEVFYGRGGLSSMVFALVLSGGVGSRLGADMPKQYHPIGGKPMVLHVLKTLQEHPHIDCIVVVAASEWRSFIGQWAEEDGITKLSGYADPGESRQLSVFSGLIKLKDLGARNDDKVVICEACRPGLSSSTLSMLIEGLVEGVDLVDATLPVYEALYLSLDGVVLDEALDRTKVLIGMEPSIARFGQFYRANVDTPSHELGSYRGTVDFFLAKKLVVSTVAGDPNGFKITTRDDLERYRVIYEQASIRSEDDTTMR